MGGSGFNYFGESCQIHIERLIMKLYLYFWPPLKQMKHGQSSSCPHFKRKKHRMLNSLSLIPIPNLLTATSNSQDLRSHSLYNLKLRAEYIQGSASVTKGNSIHPRHSSCPQWTYRTCHHDLIWLLITHWLYATGQGIQSVWTTFAKQVSDHDTSSIYWTGLQQGSKKMW